MNLRNKRYHHFLLFCKDLNMDPEELGPIIESMKENQSKIISGKKLTVEKSTETVAGILYTASLLNQGNTNDDNDDDDDNKQIRRSPIYIKKPPRSRRRAIAQIQAAVMIIGIVLVAGAAVYVVTIEQHDILSHSVSCQVTQKDLYYTSSNSAYMIIGIMNTGNEDIDVTLNFVDDLGLETIQNIGVITPEQIHTEQINMNAGTGQITEGENYIIQVTGTTANDTIDCSEQLIAK